MAEEELQMPLNNLNHIAQPTPIDLTFFFSKLEILAKKAYSNDDDISDIVQEIVPTYHKQLLHESPSS
jgi:hypothetical protein